MTKGHLFILLIITSLGACINSPGGNHISTESNPESSISTNELDKYLEVGQLYKALSDISKELSHCSKKSSSIDCGLLYLKAAQVNTYAGNLDAGLENALKARDAFRTNQTVIELGKSQNTLALIYYRLDLMDKAKEYLREAQKTWATSFDSLGYAATLTAEGYLLAREGSLDEALSRHDHARSIYKGLGDSLRYRNTFLNTGTVLLDINIDEALKCFEAAVSGLSDNRQSPVYIDALSKTAKAHILKGNFEQANNLLNESQELAKALGDPSLLAEILAHLELLAIQKSDTNKAYQFRTERNRLEDSLSVNRSAFKAAEIESQIASAKIIKENESLQQKSRSQKRWLVLTVLTTLLLISIILLIVTRYRMKVSLLEKDRTLQKRNAERQEMQNRMLEVEAKLQKAQNERLEEDIKRKKDELTSQTFAVYQKNESLQKLLEEIQTLKSTLKTEERMALRKVERSIEAELNLEDDWQRFQLHFDKVHNGFFNRLMAKHPGLSQGDLRHCAYIKLHLSTKEIAKLMNIRPESVQKSRMRLKKKLGLNRATDLMHYVNQLD
jgi:DNA-binding CsgD family transcriptional regulator